MNDLTSARGATFAMQYLRCLAAGNGSRLDAVGFANARYSANPKLCEAVRLKMVDPIASTTFGSDLASSMRDFLALVQQQTVSGRLISLRRVPFNTRYLPLTTGAVAHWVGEGKPSAFSGITLSGNKLAPLKTQSLILQTKEIVEAEGPAADGAFSADLVRACRELLDSTFVDPSRTGVSGVSPAAITVGAPTINSTGVTLATLAVDIGLLLEAFGGDLTTAAWITDPTTAARIALLSGIVGIDVGARGGTLLGLPLITTRASPRDSSGGQLALVDAAGIVFAEETPEFDISTQTTVDAATTPDDPATAATVKISLFQLGLVALRFTQFTNWRVERDGGVAILTGLFPG